MVSLSVAVIVYRHECSI